MHVVVVLPCHTCPVYVRFVVLLFLFADSICCDCINGRHCVHFQIKRADMFLCCIYLCTLWGINRSVFVLCISVCCRLYFYVFCWLYWLLLFSPVFVFLLCISRHLSFLVFVIFYSMYIRSYLSFLIFFYIYCMSHFFLSV